MTARRWAQAELLSLASRGLLRSLEALESPQGPVVRVAGRELVNFSANDYLGLAADPRLAQAMAASAQTAGVGSGASRLVTGDQAAHRSLEAALADFERAEAVLLFNAGYAANVGVVSALVSREDVVFSDALNHASLVDGCRLSRARTVVYPHGDVDALESALKSEVGRRKLVVTDAVFSMEGDLAPLPELVAACERQGAALMLDEAHATGVLGPTGAGLAEACGLIERVDIRVGTLGKSLGVFGAYAASSRPVVDLLINRARPLVFSTMLPPPVCAAAERAVGLVRSEPGLRERLWRNIHRFASGLKALGLPAEARSAVFPVLMGAPEQALAAAAFLRRRGLLVKPIRPPTVPTGTSRLRFALSAAHTEAQIDLALAGLKALQEQ